MQSLLLARGKILHGVRFRRPALNLSSVRTASNNITPSSSSFLTKLAVVSAGLFGLSWWFIPSAAQSSQKQKSENQEEKLPALSRFRVNPFNNITLHFSGFHFYAHDMTRQVPAEHYCSHLADDVHQCVIYDSERLDARIIGIEYIVPERVFQTLPEEEKKYWHSHAFEVKSGALHDPLLPVTVENAVMTKLVNSYGKTIHTWQVDRGDKLPLGPPQLMMSFTGPNQLHPQLALERDSSGCIVESSAKRRQQRAHIVPNPVVEGADHWKSGTVYQVEMVPRKADKHYNPEGQGEDWRVTLPEPVPSLEAGEETGKGKMKQSAKTHVSVGGLWDGYQVTETTPLGAEACYQRDREGKKKQ